MSTTSLAVVTTKMSITKAMSTENNPDKGQFKAFIRVVWIQ
ncbi:hypothetical protein [Paenibacillus amylolyticus]|nr:hypothetical protein [Paenibacillus amylolyticus]